MEAENGEAACWFQAFGEVTEEGIEGGELVIDGDAKGLENATDGEIDLGGGGESLEDLAEAALAVAVQVEIGKSAQYFQHLNTDIQLNPAPTPGATQEFQYR